jgi:hypothetical protein
MPRQLPTRAAAEGDQFFDALTDAVVTAQVWRTWADFVTPQLLPSATLGAAIAYMRANGTLVDDGAFADLVTAASVAWLTASGLILYIARTRSRILLKMQRFAKQRSSINYHGERRCNFPNGNATFRLWDQWLSRLSLP